MWYLLMMSERLLEMQRVLKPTGSIYLHCDPTESHSLKLMMDTIFGRDWYQSEITWQRHKSRSDSNTWGNITDIIFMYASPEFKNNPEFLKQAKSSGVKKDWRGEFYTGELTGAGTRSGESGKEWKGCDPSKRGRHWAVPNVKVGSYGSWIASYVPGYADMSGVMERLDALDASGFIYWTDSGRPYIKRYLDASSGVRVNNLWIDIPAVTGGAKERTGYPTQKPVALLERIIKASSNEGDVVLDPFCGCATTAIAAEQLGRQWIGIDVSPKAIELVQDRLHDELGLASSLANHRTDIPKRTDLGVP